MRIATKEEIDKIINLECNVVNKAYIETYKYILLVNINDFKLETCGLIKHCFQMNIKDSEFLIMYGMLTNELAYGVIKDKNYFLKK